MAQCTAAIEVHGVQTTRWRIWPSSRHQESDAGFKGEESFLIFSDIINNSAPINRCGIFLFFPFRFVARFRSRLFYPSLLFQFLE